LHQNSDKACKRISKILAPFLWWYLPPGGITFQYNLVGAFVACWGCCCCCCLFRYRFNPGTFGYTLVQYWRPTLRGVSPTSRR